MTNDRKRTKLEERAYARAVRELHELEEWSRQRKLREAHVPEEWYRIEREVPVRAKKARVTAAFDADLVRWYQSLGHGYQARMNRVLRTYMLLVISKEIRGLGSVDTYRIQSTIAAMVT
ncbi:BrnA antitoxin family protein, partial [uncultured Amaricoccus sp.]|uniref:BrnA antitoxin family protein n=1 Tax=uncultured Amaricoccus sp. TaxID=339341 RepID=UPI002613D163